MKRRTLIKELMLVAGGFMLVPACLQPHGKSDAVFKHFTITDAQAQLLKAVTSAIIPATDTPGAGELGCHLFVLKMLDDCYETKTQERFIKGLNNLDDYAKNRFTHSFLKCTEQQQQEILNDIEEKKPTDADLTKFYELMKQRTIEGYMTSKYVLTNINKYEFIPSEKYNGYVPVTT